MVCVRLIRRAGGMKSAWLLLAAFVLAGCGISAAGQETAHPRCARGVAAPISLRAAKRALASVGYRTTLDKSLCERTGVEANQGDLVFASTNCTVAMHSPPRQTARPAARFEGSNYSGKAYVVRYNNVDCWVYDSGAARDRIVANLRRVFEKFGAHRVIVHEPQA